MLLCFSKIWQIFGIGTGIELPVSINNKFKRKDYKQINFQEEKQ